MDLEFYQQASYGISELWIFWIDSMISDDFHNTVLNTLVHLNFNMHKFETIEQSEIFLNKKANVRKRNKIIGICSITNIEELSTYWNSKTSQF